MTAAVDWFAGLSLHASDAPVRIVDEQREREAHVHVWLAHLCRVEAAKLAGLTASRVAGIPTDDEIERAAAALQAAKRRDERAYALAGCTTAREREALTERAMRRFRQPEPEGA